MKSRKSQRRVKQCLDLVKLIRNRPRPQPYYFQRSRSNAGRSRRNESNCFCYNTTSNSHRSCIFKCHNLHPHALATNHSSFHIPNCYSRINSDCNSSEEIGPKSSILSKPDVELFETESYNLVNELSKISNTTPNANTTQNTSTLPQEVEDHASPSCSNNRKSETEETTDELKPNDEVSTSESTAKSNETISAEVSNEENTLNASQSALNAGQSALEHDATTTVAEPNVSRQLSTDEEAGGDGHHNNSVIEIEITLLSGNDTNSEEEDEGEGDAEAEANDETPMPVESGE